MGSKVQIKHRFTGAVLFECDVPEEHSGMAMRHALEVAAKSGANLYGANLYGSDLSGSDLSGADLSRADLYGANLYGANLYGADLSGADLSRADLSGANLSRADLSGSNLSGANLYGSDLYGSDLSGAKIDGEEITISPISISGLEWSVLITDGVLRIGCQRHSHAEWAEFTEDQIIEMSANASEFWSQWKAPLLAMCKAHASKVVKTESVDD